MSINFNEKTSWSLKAIGVNEVRKEVARVLIPGEQIVMAFQAVRDQLLFTNKRIIAINWGGRKAFNTLPYSQIQYFYVQASEFEGNFPDAELYIMFSSGFTAKFEFKSNVDLGKLGQMLSQYVLKD